MLILFYFFTINEVLPRLEVYAEALIPTVAVSLIMIIGIIGMIIPKFFSNLGSNIKNGIFKGIKYLVKSLINAISWLVRNFLRMIQKLFNKTRQLFLNRGISALASNLLATIIVALVVLVII